MLRRTSYLVLLACALLLGAHPDNAVIAKEPARAEYGTIKAIEIYRGTDDNPVSVGTLVGGVAGGVIGHQIGRGRGNTAATIIGAVGGAAVGNEIEKKQAQVSRYRITIQLESGSTLVIEDTHEAELRVGDRVRVEDNHVYRM